MMDSRGRKPKPGDRVVLTAVPPGFLNDLPAADQQAILEIVGKAILLNEYDDFGRAEIRFADSCGQVHFLYVNPDFIRAAE